MLLHLLNLLLLLLPQAGRDKTMSGWSSDNPDWVGVSDSSRVAGVAVAHNQLCGRGRLNCSRRHPLLLLMLLLLLLPLLLQRLLRVRRRLLQLRGPPGPSPSPTPPRGDRQQLVGLLLPAHITYRVRQRHDVVLGQRERLDLGQLPGLVHVGDYLAETLEKRKRGKTPS